jgi:hypothetical protein
VPIQTPIGLDEFTGEFHQTEPFLISSDGFETDPGSRVLPRKHGEVDLCFTHGNLSPLSNCSSMVRRAVAFASARAATTGSDQEASQVRFGMVRHARPS